MSDTSNSHNPVIKALKEFHAKHHDDMPGGAAKLLNGLTKSIILSTTNTQVHFDKTDALQHSGGSALSEESKRKRVLQLNNYFEQESAELKIISRKNTYILEVPTTLIEQIKHQAFEDYALGIADETDPDDFQTPEADIGRLVFVSHNWRDKETLSISRAFLQELEQQLADRATDELMIEVFCDLSENNNFKLHKGLHEQQDALCRQAQLCLILWNPGYEKSEACQRELSFFVDEQGQNRANKNAIAMLERGRNKDIKNSKTQKISKRILFNYPHGSDHSLTKFWHDASPADKYDYVASLVDHIEACFTDKSQQPSQEQRLRDSLIKATDISVDEGLDQDLCDGDKHQIPEGFQASLSETNRIEIVPCLGEWANAIATTESSVARVSVLLGDFGFGKTVTCRLLARHLSEIYKQQQQSTLLPIYLDLKALLGDLDKHRNLPVEHLLETMLAKTGREAEFKGSNIINYIRTQKCLVIFDGFDEIGHKLNPADQQAMYHKLLDIIPSAVYSNDARGPKHKKWLPDLAKFPSKLLISCRTHFFNHIRQETRFLTGSERHAISESNIQRFYMAPFKPEAIKNYLIDALGSDEEGDKAYTMLGDIHDLSDLSKHPIMLRLISQQIPFLQEMKAQGKKVNSASLYTKMFESIGERDHAKHIIKLSRKHKLLASLAFDLWLQGKTQLHFEKLEDWFTHYSGKDALLNRQTADPEQFDSMVTDLCNATLLVRDSEDKYRFAHTSYLEFFRALGIFEFIASAATNNGATANTNINANTVSTDNKHADEYQAFSQLSELPTLNNETLQFIINWWQVCNDDVRAEFDAGFIKLLERPENQQSKWLSFYIWRFALQSIGHPDLSHFPHSISPDWSGMEFGEDFIAPDIIKSLATSAESVKLDESLASAGPIAKIPVINLSQAKFDNSYFFNQHFLKLNLTRASFANSRIYQCQFTEVLTQERVFAQAILRHTRPPIKSPNLVKAESTVQYQPPQYKLTILQGHNRSINAICYSHDSKLLATAGDDGIIHIWNTADSKAFPQWLYSLHGHQGRILTLAFTHDGNMLASAGDDSTIRLWDTSRATSENKHQIQKPTCLHELKGHQVEINTLAFAHDSKMLASAGDDNTIRLWDTSHANPENKHEIHYQHQEPTCSHELKGHENQIFTLAFAHDSKILASADLDSIIRLWDTSHAKGEYQNQKPACLHELKGHRGRIFTLAFAHDSTMLASAGDDSTIRLWDTANANPENKHQIQKPVCLHELKGHEAGIFTLAFAHNSKMLASACDDYTIRLWDTSHANRETLNQITPQHQEPTCLHELKGHRRLIRCLAFAHDSTMLVSAGSDSTIRLWDTSHANPENKHQIHYQQQKPACLHQLKGHQDSINTLVFGHNSKMLASAGSNKTIRLWNTSHADGENQKQKTAGLYQLKGHQSRISTLAFAHDSHMLASAGLDSTIRLWDTSCAKNENPKSVCLHKLKGHKHGIFTLAFAHDNKFLASAGSDSTIRIWDTANANPENKHQIQKPACLHKLKGHQDSIYTLAFAHDSKMLASAGDDHIIRLWDTANANPENKHQIQKPACLYELKGHQDWIHSITFAHDSTLLASADYDSTIRLWDTANANSENQQQKPTCLHELKGEGYILTLAFAHNSKMLASAGLDSTIRLWDCADLSKQPPCIKVLSGANFSVGALQFSADNQYLYCSSLDEILVWDLQSFQCVKLIRQLPDGYIVFATESDGEQIIYKQLLEAQGDAWDYLQAIDANGKALPAACHQDWDKLYRP